MKVVELTPVSVGVGLRVKVIHSIVTLTKKQGDEKVRVAELLVGDETACVILLVRNEQIDTAKPGTYLIIENGSIQMKFGFMQLFISNNATIQEDPNPKILKVNEGENISLIEYQLVNK